MKQFLTKHKELIRYIMFGCCTTLVNWLVHFVFVALIPAAKTNQVLNTAATGAPVFTGGTGAAGTARRLPQFGQKG